jgi:hypothetical protein
VINRLIAWHGWRTDNDWGFWFRVFGYGVAVSTMVPNFSERNGYTPYLRFGRVKLVGLRPWWRS